MATRKTTSRKPSTTAAKPVPSSPAKTAAAAATATAAKPTTTPGEGAADTGVQALKKKELFERVKARAEGVKGHDVRVVMDAMLHELGALLVAGEALNAQPLGMLKVQKHKPLAGADVVVCKLRRKKPGGAEKDPLAKAAE